MKISLHSAMTEGLCYIIDRETWIAAMKKVVVDKVTILVSGHCGSTVMVLLRIDDRKIMTFIDSIVVF